MPGAHLYQRGEVWWCHFSVAGRLIRQSTTRRDRGEAAERAAALYIKACADARVTPAGASDTTTEAAVAAYLIDLERRIDRRELTRGPRYYEGEETHFRVRLQPRWEKLHQITSEEWSRALADWHAEGATWRTLQTCTVAARHLLRWCVKSRLLDEAPNLEAPSGEDVAVEAKERRPLTRRERDALLAALKRLSPRAWRIYMVLFYTAARKSDIERLSLRQVDFVNERLHFPPRQTKSKARDQDVWLHPKAAAAIKSELRARGKINPEDLIFGPFNLRREFERALDAAKITDRTGLTAHHSTRHTAATLAGDDGADLAALMALGRWATPQMAARYMKVQVARSKTALERL